MENTSGLTQLPARFTLPLGRQVIELSETDFEAGGMAMLRVRIREGKRFTIFDVDPVNAAAWGKAMQDWAAGALTVESERQANRAAE